MPVTCYPVVQPVYNHCTGYDIDFAVLRTKFQIDCSTEIDILDVRYR